MGWVKFEDEYADVIITNIEEYFTARPRGRIRELRIFRAVINLTSGISK